MISSPILARTLNSLTSLHLISESIILSLDPYDLNSYHHPNQNTQNCDLYK